MIKLAELRDSISTLIEVHGPDVPVAIPSMAQRDPHYPGISFVSGCVHKPYSGPHSEPDHVLIQ